MEVLSSVVESFKCHECSFTCEERYSFLSHFFNHHVNPLDAFNEQSKQGFTCAICLSLFEDVEKLRQHYIVIHNYQSTTDETPVKHKVPASPVPVVVFEQPSVSNVQDPDPAPPKPANLEFNAFKEKLTSEFIHKCTKKKCKLKFPSVEQRDQHTRCHNSDGSEGSYLFKCTQCPAESDGFKKWIECCMHLWKAHQCDVGLLKCPLCNYRSQISVKVFRHLQTHSEMKGYECTLCEKPRSFAQEAQLKRHMVMHESTDADANKKVRWYSQKTCEICQHVFANSKTLSKHIKQVHNKIKPFICKVCGYKAARKATITIHERQHTGERPLSCKVEGCDFRAADPSVLVKHMKKHDTGNSSTNYQCPKCDYTTIQAPALKNHIRAKHEDFYPQIKCDQCNFTSINEKTLNLHKLDHKAGLIEDSNQSEASSIDNKMHRDNKHNISNEISSDCFLPLESTDSITHDTGGVTIPHHTSSSAAAHSEDTQFPN